MTVIRTMEELGRALDKGEEMERVNFVKGGWETICSIMVTIPELREMVRRGQVRTKQQPQTLRIVVERERGSDRVVRAWPIVDKIKVESFPLDPIWNGCYQEQYTIILNEPRHE